MSYILDALKRSEQERHQDKMPSFSAESMILQTNQKKSHWWPYALILVLVLNAIALYFFSRDASDDSKKQIQPTPAQQDREQVINNQQEKLSVSTIQKRPPPSNIVKERQYIQPITKAPPNSSEAVNSNRTDDHLYGTTVDDGLLIKPKPNFMATAKQEQLTAINQVEDYPIEPSVIIKPSSYHLSLIHI